MVHTPRQFERCERRSRSRYTEAEATSMSRVKYGVVCVPLITFAVLYGGKGDGVSRLSRIYVCGSTYMSG